MLVDPRVEKMAQVLVHYSLGVQPGMQVCINSTTLAAPLIGAVYREVLVAGGHPTTHLNLPGLTEELLAHATGDQLDYASPFTRILWEQFDAMLNIGAPLNTHENAGADPARMNRYQQAQRRYNKSFAWRVEGKPYCLTQFPTAAYAQAAEMSLRDYEDFVFRACMLDRPDPVAAWQELRDMQERLVQWLAGRRTVHVESKDADLILSIEGRTFLNSDGHYNFPSGEIFTGPGEDSVNGHIHFTYPAHYLGRDVDDVTLHFKDGRVERWEAGRGAEFLESILDRDAGARRLGEFAIGTNEGVDRFTRNVLYDEKMAGTIHCALGQTYAQTGGTNQSSVHWDMVTDMRAGRITADGAVFYENGRFVI
jgi:aminopeptidase